MKPSARVRQMMAICGLIFIMGLPASVLAKESEEFTLAGKWGVGLRGGPSIPTHDIVDNIPSPIEADAAITVSGNLLYALTDFLNLGLLVEYERYKIDFANIDVGQMNTVSLMPFFELRHIIQGSAGVAVPYIFMAGGVHFNSLEESSTLPSGCQQAFGSSDCAFDPPTGAGIKAGGGVDYFVTEGLALNTEIAWKSNEGNADIRRGGTEQTEQFTANKITFLIGLRYYFSLF